MCSRDKASPLTKENGSAEGVLFGVKDTFIIFVLVNDKSMFSTSCQKAGEVNAGYTEAMTSFRYATP